jgi:hypothetical protein
LIAERALPVIKEGLVAAKNAQINLRLPADLDRWVLERAGGSREKPAFVREVLERERAREAEAELQAMFDDAWDSLSPEEREAERRDRETVLGAYARNEKG